MSVRKSKARAFRTVSVIAIVSSIGLTQAAHAQVAAIPDIAPVTGRAETSPLAASSQPSVEGTGSEDRGGEQVVLLELDVVYDGASLGPIIARTSLVSVKAVDTAQLAARLDGLVEDTALTALRALPGGLVSVEQVKTAGVSVSLDAKTLALIIDAPRAADPEQNVSLASGGRNFDRVNVQPSNFAAGVTTAFRVNDAIDGDVDRLIEMGYSAFANFGGVRGVNLDVAGDWTIEGGGQGLPSMRLDRAVAFMDRPEKARRYQAGTLFSQLSPNAGFSDYLGIGIVQSYRELQPTRVLRPLGRRSFQLERPAEVIVLVNGREISRFNAAAGPVNLSEIPLIDLSNDVSILIEDEFGRRTAENFSVASDIDLLREGLTEFSAGIGQQRDFNSFTLSYSGDWIASGSVQHGVTSGYTQGAYAVASENYYLLGSRSTVTALNGLAEFEGSVSHERGFGTGFSVAAEYRWNNAVTSPRGQDLALSAQYRDRKFRSAGSLFDSDIKFDLAATYQIELTKRVRLNLSGSYQDRYSSDESFRVGSVGASFNLSDFFVTASVRHTSGGNRPNQTGFFINVVRQIGRRTSILGNFDSATERGSIGVRKFSPNRLDSFDYSAEVVTQRSEASFRGDVGYRHNRFDTRLSVDRLSGGGRFGGDTLMSFEFQSGLAFADGKLGIGRDPGRGFYLIDAHPSLKDAEIQFTTGGPDDVRAKTDGFGPAVASIFSPFLPEISEIRVKDAPIGYNLDDSRIVAVPGARSGYSIQVGSDNFRSIVIRFERLGEPFGLRSGILTELRTGDTQVVFTNRTGRTAISDLAPGEYRLEFADGEAVYTFQIAPDGEIFEDIGTVQLEETE